MLFCYVPMQAQIKDTLTEVHIKTRRRRVISADDRLNLFSPGQRIQTIDSITLEQYKFQSVSNLLAQQTSVFVRSYGFNGLATLNFRGASAAQSQVYWNGVPLQNAALGISDVSLLPVSLLNKVHVVYGSSSALWGSGNVGGALAVENDAAAFDSAGSFRHSVSAVAGSFGQYRAGIKSALSTRKWYLALNAFGQTAANDFSFSVGDSVAHTRNSKMQSGVGLLQAGYKINRYNTLNFYGWYQQYHREIPAALFESFSVKNQRDESLRLLLDWTRKKDRTKYYTKAAFISDRMLYNDTTVALNTDNVTQQFYAEAGIKHSFNADHEILLFVPMQLSRIIRNSMNDEHTQNRIALAGAWSMRFWNDHLHISLNGRAEQINDIDILLPGANASFNLTPWLLLKANVQRSYRAPTLNELYYVPGGNDNLKPEQGWNVDGGYVLKTNAEKAVTFTQDVSVFNRVINDWIIWFGGAIWTPHNMATVHSRGVETENKLEWRINNVKLHMGINTAYVLATTVKSYMPGDGSIGKQIPYAPRYSGQANIGFAYRGWHFNYNHTYTGYRFITVDESQYVEPYTTGNMQLLYSTYISGFPLQLNMQANNIFNQHYYVVNARPMPGINWLAGLSVTLSH